jgi:tetratricopeptide (TPR) repeat protein
LSAPALAQSPPQDEAGIRETINRIGGDLFSPTPHPAEAIRELKEILAQKPRLAEAHLLLGIAYRAQGSPELMGEAVAELRQALDLNPALGVARLALARVYLDMARGARAREELEVALQHVPDNPQVLSLLGEAERSAGNPRRSVDLNARVLEAHPGFVQARYYLALALMDLDRDAEAIRELETVVTSGANPAEARAALGTAYLDIGRTDDAIETLEEAVRLDPSRSDTHLRLARAYRTKGMLAQAQKALAGAHPAPGSLAALYHNAEGEYFLEQGIIRLQQGRLQPAIDAFEKALKADSGNEQAKLGLAEARKRLKSAPRKPSEKQP